MSTTPALVCPVCGEPAVRRPPTSWQPSAGRRPDCSHPDGEPLCPVIGEGGYWPADPVPARCAPRAGPPWSARPAPPTRLVGGRASLRPDREARPGP